MGVKKRLEGRVAIVTGGAHGIGREYCFAYAEEGASIAILDLDGVRAKQTAADIVEAGGDAIGVEADISEEAAAIDAVKTVLQHYGHIEVLMNNAAMFSVVEMSRVGFDELTVAEWDKMMAINVRGTWLMCREVGKHMRERGYGKIINICSGSVFKGVASQIHYVTSKSAIFGFTHNLARELGPHGVTVNAIAPGSTLSEENPTEDVLRMREQTARTRALPRVQMPADLVGAAIFLAAAESDFITGQTIVVDGGAYMH